MKVTVLMPCLDDSTTAAELIVETAENLIQNGHEPSFLLVDDGSTRPLADCLEELLPNPPCPVRVLRLKRNLGHQRAIACGICHLALKTRELDVVVIMDSDGEDRPHDVGRLVQALRESDPSVVVAFAERMRRTEGLIFRIGYRLYLGLHHLLVGQAPRVGNFSALAASTLSALVTDSDLWSHYAATLWKHRYHRVLVPAHRGKRRRGTSRLSLGDLVLHGLGAISCYRETMAVRILFGSGMLLAAAVLVFMALLIEASLSGRTAASPLIVGSGLMACFLLQFTLLALWQCFNTLQKRHQATFIPVRDSIYFVPEETILVGQASVGTTASASRIKRAQDTLQR